MASNVTKEESGRQPDYFDDVADEESRWENFVAHSLVAWFNDLLK
jgi:hypothetical protein